MGHFAITFRIKSDSGYQGRYDSFVEKVKEISSELWEETSSFYVIKADATAAEIRDKLYFGTKFNATLDVMVVIDLHNKEHSEKGANYPATLRLALGFD